MSWAGSAARAKSRIGTRRDQRDQPGRAAGRTGRSPANTPRCRTRSRRPVRRRRARRAAASARRRRSAPGHTIQRTSTSIASPSARKKPTQDVARAAGLRAIASASSNVNNISGSIAPVAAAATGLVGISDVSQLAKPTAGAPAASDRRCLRGARRQCRPHGRDTREQRKTARCPAAVASASRRPACAMNTASVRPPIRPIVDTSAADATPVISSETTSGITVIRIAFTQSVPMDRDRIGRAEQRRVVRRADQRGRRRGRRPVRSRTAPAVCSRTRSGTS